NKQLISIFFVGVALCAVFFAFGYWIGHNTSKPVTSGADTAAGAANTIAPATQEPEPPRETAATDSQSPQAPTPALADAQSPQDATDASTGPATKTRAAQDAPVTATAVTPVVPQPGATYLQVTALRRDDAEKLVKTLKEQSFPALIADSSKPDLFRVMVGPYHQTSDVADAKAKLKALGFANAFVQK